MLLNKKITAQLTPGEYVGTIRAIEVLVKEPQLIEYAVALKGTSLTVGKHSMDTDADVVRFHLTTSDDKPVKFMMFSEDVIEAQADAIKKQLSHINSDEVLEVLAESIGSSVVFEVWEKENESSDKVYTNYSFSLKSDRMKENDNILV